MSCDTTIDTNYYPSVLFSETFEYTDGTILNSLDNWTVTNNGGSVVINSNRAEFTQSGVTNPFAFYNTNFAEANITISIKFTVLVSNYTTATAGDVLIFGRSQSLTAFTSAYACGLDINQNLNIVLNNAGTPSVLAISTATAPLAQNDEYQLDMTFASGAITCSLSGAASISLTATDTTFSTGFAGLAGARTVLRG